MRASISQGVGDRRSLLARIAGAPVECFEHQPQSGQALTEVIVQIPRDPSPLLFLCGDEPAQEPDPGRLGLGAIGDFGRQQRLRFRKLASRLVRLVEDVSVSVRTIAVRRRRDGDAKLMGRNGIAHQSAVVPERQNRRLEHTADFHPHA